MATVLLTIKIMPESPDSDLQEIKSKINDFIESQEAKSIVFEEKPIAFGLKAVYVKFALDESKGTDFVEQELSKIPHVSSVTIEDYRRAFG